LALFAGNCDQCNPCQDYVKDIGVRVHSTSAPKGVLEAQVENGFAFVSEGALESLLGLKGQALPEGSEEEEHRKTTLALACVLACKPDYDAQAASKVINKAFLAENPDCYASLHVDEDALCDVVNKGEAKKIAEYNVQVQQTKATKALVMQTRDDYVGKHFKKGEVPKYTSAQKKQPRWLPSQDTAATSVITDWIRKYLPAEVQVECDDYNGRWRVIAPTLNWRSISWTKRGYEKAAFEVIHQAWEYETDWSGLKPPFSLEELEKRFRDNA
jgi:hypothetical protein